MTSSPTTDLGKHALRAHFWTTVCASAPDFWTLTKPEVNFLIVIATFTGFYLGCPTNLYRFPLARLNPWWAFVSKIAQGDRRTGRMQCNINGQLLSFGIEASRGEITRCEIARFARNI